MEILFKRKAKSIDERPEIICNISNETNEWNKMALKYAWREGGSLILYRIPFTAEEAKKIQEKTYEDNRTRLERKGLAENQ